MRPSLAAHEFGRVGVALLRHDRRLCLGSQRAPSRTGSSIMPQKRIAGVVQRTISSAKRIAQMGRRDRCGAQRFEGEVPIGDACRERIGGSWPVGSRAHGRSLSGRWERKLAAALSGHSLRRLRTSLKLPGVARANIS